MAPALTGYRHTSAAWTRCASAPNGCGRGKPASCRTHTWRTLRTRLADLGVPTLFLHWRQRHDLPASLAVTAADQIANARAVVIDSAGHMRQVDEPDRWIDALASFLN